MKFKRLGSIAIAAAIMATFSMTAFAEEDPSGDYTIIAANENTPEAAEETTAADTTVAAEGTAPEAAEADEEVTDDDLAALADALDALDEDTLDAIADFAAMFEDEEAAALFEGIEAALADLSDEDKAALAALIASADLSDLDAVIEEIEASLSDLSEEDIAAIRALFGGAAADGAAEEIDWDQYDFEAAVAANEEFQLGGKLDLIGVLGEGWNKFTKIEADFIWTPGEKWCGGAGIGAAVNGVDGSTWIMGAEFGAANANEAVAPDGKATQTILDMGTPLVSIASVDDKGNWSFGELQVQNWWNGTEAGAKVAALRFLDADDNLIKEVVFIDTADDEPAEEPASEPTTGDVDAATDSSKGSPDTGVADVAAVAGLAIVAAGAVVVAKKRK